MMVIDNIYVPNDVVDEIQENGPRSFLSGVLKRSRDIEYKQKELRRLLDSRTSLKGISYDSVRVQTSGKSDGFSSVIEKIVDKESDLKRLMMDSMEERNTVISMISGLDNPIQCDVLYKYYIENKTYETIMDEMNLTYDSVRSFLRRGIKAFGEKYGK